MRLTAQVGLSMAGASAGVRACPPIPALTADEQKQKLEEQS